MLWRMFPGAFPEEKCDEIISLGLSLGTEDATVFNNSESVRRSQVGWIDNRELLENLHHLVTIANSELFAFDVHKVAPIQFTKYSSDDSGWYDWHHDVDYASTKAFSRKLSVTVQLSDPRAYAGGDLQFSECENPDSEVLRAKGTAIVFPSYLRHRVTPVTSGRRYSLVSWFEGPRWR